MPHYFIDTFDGIAAIDDEGQELPDIPALRKEIRRSLAAMMRDKGDGDSTAQFRADARDASGKRILTAGLMMVIEDAD